MFARFPPTPKGDAMNGEQDGVPAEQKGPGCRCQGRSPEREICAPARAAQASTWCGSHFQKYSCHYYSTMLSHLSSCVWG